MAFSFNGTNQFLNTTSTPVTGTPLTLAGWFFTTNTSQNMCVVSVCESDAGVNSQSVNLNGAGSTTKPLYMFTRSTSALDSGVSASDYPTSAWASGVGVTQSATSRYGYLNGIAGAQNTTSITPGNLARIQIGRYLPSGGTNYMAGQLAEVAVWSVVLTDAEITSLSKGFKPPRVRPQSLVFYAPLIRNLQDTKGALALTNNNTATVTDHPRVY